MAQASRHNIKKKQAFPAAADSSRAGRDPDEAKLCERLNKGDDLAFSEAYGRYVGRLTRYVWGRVPDRDTVEDLVSEVFFKLWQFLKFGGKITYLPAFLFRSTKNIMKDFFRRKARHDTIPFSVIEGSKLERTLASPKEELEEQMDVQLNWERFMLLVRTLPERQRRVVLLRFVDRMKTKDIAQICQLSHANTRVLLYRGLRALRVMQEQSPAPVAALKSTPSQE